MSYSQLPEYEESRSTFYMDSAAVRDRAHKKRNITKISAVSVSCASTDIGDSRPA